MKEILLEELGDRLSIGTTDLGGYINLPLKGRIAETSRLDNNTCQKTFECSANELRNIIHEKGY